MHYWSLNLFLYDKIITNPYFSSSILFISQGVCSFLPQIPLIRKQNKPYSHCDQMFHYSPIQEIRILFVKLCIIFFFGHITFNYFCSFISLLYQIEQPQLSSPTTSHPTSSTSYQYTPNPSSQRPQSYQYHSVRSPATTQ